MAGEYEDRNETRPPEEETPGVDPAVKAHVNDWCETIRESKEYFKDDFVEMRKCQQLAKYGADKEWIKNGGYTVPVIQRHINQAVASVYAKNPTVVAEASERLLAVNWDGRPESVHLLLQKQAQGFPLMPDEQAVLDEVQAIQAEQMRVERMGKTLEILFNYYFKEQAANYVQRFKHLVRRAKTQAVGYVKLGFQRQLRPRPEIEGGIPDAAMLLSRYESEIKRYAEDPTRYPQDDADFERLRVLVERVEGDPWVVVREGPVLTFPWPTRVIVDPATEHLATFTGTGWVAEEYPMSAARIRAVYGVDVKSQYTQYKKDSDGKGDGTDRDKKKDYACVYEVWDRDTETVFTICEGYADYLRAPAAPDYYLERFFPYFPLVFNESDHEDEIYPRSDVFALKDPQQEYNTSRHALRDHRRANRPKYFARKGALTDEDRQALGAHRGNCVYELDGLVGSEKIDEIIQRMPTQNIDPNLYETGSIHDDILRAVGAQEANLGGLSGATATESTIAETSRSTAQADDIDDLDEMLTDLARAMAQLMLTELSMDTVQEIVGPGAVWPESPLTREVAAKEVSLGIQAGSSGRPNQAMELANLERAVPYLIQIPDLNPGEIARTYGTLLNMDVDRMRMPGAPSIVAMNALAGRQVQGGDASGPNGQGGAGADNRARSAGNEPQSQPAFPAGASDQGGTPA